MSRTSTWLGILLTLTAVAISGCSTVTPNLADTGQRPMDQWLSEQKLINHIQCQLASAVHAASEINEANPQISPELRASWIHEWGAKASLVMTVNNKDILSPGLQITHPLENAIAVFPKNGNVPTSRNRGLGFGATFGADATRTESISFFYSFEELLRSPIAPAQCKVSEGPYLSSDLKIADFLEKGVSMSLQPGVLGITRKAGVSPYQTFTYEVKFIVTRSANVNPSFKLVEISADQSGSLYSTSRIRTDDLTITMGKVETKDGKTSPSSEFDQQHLANLIGQAVSNAIQGHQQQ